MPKILVIVPAFNEEKNISNVIREIKAGRPSDDILIISDGSQDRTADEARKENIFVIALPVNLGIGAAVQTGFQFALREGYDIVVRVDGDGQHDAAYLEKLIKAVVNGDTDIALGSRFIHPGTNYRSSFVRRLGIHFFASVISHLTGFSITDPTSGFRAYHSNSFGLFSQDYPQDFPEPEEIVAARRNGLCVKEVGVVMRKRIAGNSSIRYAKTLYYMIKVTLAILLDLLKTKKG